MRQEFWFAILVAILILTPPTIVQAQQSDASKVEDDAAADPEKLRILAGGDDQDAQYQLAEKYRMGLMVEQDHEKAIELYNLSAVQGFASSQFRLGELYEKGDIVERDLGKAIESYRKAAGQGHPDAQYALAHIYHIGSGVEQDMAAALDWYHKAALQGDESSQLALGDQYRIGLAVPRDLAQATRWYRRAADQGNLFAQFELGNAYRYGNGVERDIPQAIKWYRLSADAGNPSAQLALKELEASETAAVSVTAATRDLEDPRDVGSLELAGALETDLIFSEIAMRTTTEENAAMQLPEPEEAPRSGTSVPESDAAAPDNELAYAAELAYNDEAEVSLLLAHAEYQVASLALTTPAGENAYETYQLILSLQPSNEAALNGIEQIGVKYVELASLAAAKGDVQKTNHYAAKAEELAPEHPLVQSMTVRTEADRAAFEETTPPPEILADFKAPPEVSKELEEEPAKIQVANVTSASATLEDLIEDADDLVLKPYDYQGRQVAVVGPVVHLFWDYRLVAETSQNSIVIDVDGLSQADRDKLDAAIDEAGFLGQVQARIKGTIERQALATFELAATELALTGFAIGKDEASGPDLGTDIDEAGRLFVPVYPGELFVQPNAFNNPTRSGGRGRASTSAASSDAGGSDGASDGGSSSAGSGGSDGASDGGSSSAGSGGSDGASGGGSGSAGSGGSDGASGGGSGSAGSGGSDGASDGGSSSAGGDGSGKGKGKGNGNGNGNGNGKGKGNGKGGSKN